ncbi:MAG: Hsp20/alpha crystallin family protein [Alphaproteobacteria bacterium]|nr:Hsp20/alpha crystallin family protein [Alphaproteobacteria bacterium]
MTKQLDIHRLAKSLPATNELWTSFRGELDDLFDRFSTGFESYAMKPLSNLEDYWAKSFQDFAPLAVDVAENDKTYVITAELPGVNEKDIEVSVQDGTLVIKGQKLQEKEEKGEHRYMKERRYGSFRRTFELPKGTDEAKLEARFHNGVLTVSVPKPAATQARKVDVKAA